jgi:phospholipase/lecithinase/hemolysin
MRKGLSACLALLAPALVFSMPHYSRVIIFGDSMADIGNMPESPGLTKPKLNISPLNLYVPVSNPFINGQQKNYSLLGSGEKHPFPAPAPQPQPPLSAQNKTTKRAAHSLSWSQFFTQRAADAGMLKNAQIWPWFWWKTHPNNNTNLSLNYAWLGALTNNDCRNYSYRSLTEGCNEKDILEAQAAYRKTGFGQGNEPIGTVKIPGLGKQIELFLSDSKKHPEIAQPDTLYVVLEGADNLLFSLMNVKERKTQTNFGEVLDQSASRVTSAIERLIKERGAKHIVLFNLFDITQMPYIRTTIWQKNLFQAKNQGSFFQFSRLITQIYNRELGSEIFKLKKEYNKNGKHLDIRLFNFYKLMKDLQVMPEFSSEETLYKPCIDNSLSRPVAYYASANTCEDGTKKYLFWSGKNLTGYANQFVADKLLKLLQTEGTG